MDSLNWVPGDQTAFLIGSPWISDFPALGLCFLIYKMGCTRHFPEILQLQGGGWGHGLHWMPPHPHPIPLTPISLTPAYFSQAPQVLDVTMTQYPSTAFPALWCLVLKWCRIPHSVTQKPKPFFWFLIHAGEVDVPLASIVSWDLQFFGWLCHAKSALIQESPLGFYNNNHFPYTRHPWA